MKTLPRSKQTLYHTYNMAFSDLIGYFNLRFSFPITMCFPTLIWHDMESSSNLLVQRTEIVVPSGVKSRNKMWKAGKG